MNEILVATDLSTPSGWALGMAVEIAARSQVHVRLLHIVEHPQGTILNISGDFNLEEAEENEEIRQYMDRARTEVKKIAEEYPGIDLRPEVQLGKPVTSVAESIKEESADLIIVSSRGADKADMLGSTTEELVRKATCPVITVKSKLHADGIKDIVFATNFIERQSHVVEELKDLQRLFEAKLHLLKVNIFDNLPLDENTRKEMENFVEQYDIGYYTLNYTNNPVEEDGIIQFANEIQADMIAIATHGRTGIRHLIYGSVAEDIVKHAKRPVWTCRLRL